MLQAAERDLLTLRHMKSGVPDESFGFHVQQAAEKALRALLALRGRTYPPTPNLHNLFAWLAVFSWLCGCVDHGAHPDTGAGLTPVEDWTTGGA